MEKNGSSNLNVKNRN